MVNIHTPWLDSGTPGTDLRGIVDGEVQARQGGLPAHIRVVALEGSHGMIACKPFSVNDLFWVSCETELVRFYRQNILVLFGGIMLYN